MSASLLAALSSARRESSRNSRLSSLAFLARDFAALLPTGHVPSSTDTVTGTATVSTRAAFLAFAERVCNWLLHLGATYSAFTSSFLLAPVWSKFEGLLLAVLNIILDQDYERIENGRPVCLGVLVSPPDGVDGRGKPGIAQRSVLCTGP
ncbi:hypothetical protein BX666DRAFT_2033108 [Dichotomocladium elegans]|nr:hypothetical protein BX666DRAFT_2033108 [Dichotomocladium elegans]